MKAKAMLSICLAVLAAVAPIAASAADGALGLGGRDFRFGFKFVDSTVSLKDPLDFYDLGVVEPLGRVDFVYCGE